MNHNDSNMKTRPFTLGFAAIVCALAVALPVTPAAAIDDQQFNELKDLVNKLSQKVDKQDQRIEQLQKTHDQDAQVHSQDQKTHDQDQQKIQELEQKLGETQKTVADVQQKAALAVPAEPRPRVPLDEGTVNAPIFPFSAMQRFKSPRLPGRMRPFCWPILRLFFCIEAGKMSSSKPGSTSVCRTTLRAAPDRLPPSI